jgi:ADP-ribose pyrophosphatase
MKEVKILRSELAYQGRGIRIIKDTVQTSDGATRQREFVHHPGASLIIPMLDDGNFILERQYRHALRKVFIEFPAGKLDPGEDPLAAAKRELKEETGFEAAEWKRLGLIHPCIGYSNEFIEIFLAKGLVQKGANPDPGEDLEVFSMSPGELRRLIHTGEVTDVKTMTAMQLFDFDCEAHLSIQPKD